MLRFIRIYTQCKARLSHIFRTETCNFRLLPCQRKLTVGMVGWPVSKQLFNIILDELKVILGRLFSPRSANFLLRFQLFLAIQTFSPPPHIQRGDPATWKLFLLVLVKSCGFLMSDLSASIPCLADRRQLEATLSPIFVSQRPKARRKFGT